jgi:hypothetical protein
MSFDFRVSRICLILQIYSIDVVFLATEAITIYFRTLISKENGREARALKMFGFEV